MSFPLLRLPLVASTNVINSIDIEDFFPLIRTSTRMKNLIKYSRVPIELFVKGDNYIEFKKLSDPDRTKRVELFLPPRSKEQKTYVPLDSSIRFPFDSSIPFIRRESNRKCERNLEEYRKLMNDFVDIFLVKSVDLNVIVVGVSEVCLQYLEYAVSLGLRIKNVSMSVSEKYRVEDTRKLLLACAHISSLIAYMHHPPADSVLECFQELAVDNLELTVWPRGGWITLDHLFALVNCSNVHIEHVHLNEADLNKFLKYWLSGAGRMKTLAIQLEKEHRREAAINTQLVMEGIPRGEIERNNKFEIERSDGVKTVVWIYGIAFTLGGIDPHTLSY